MEKNVKKWLLDILSSIDYIYEFIGEKRDYNHYSTNRQLRSSVEREIEIIGEAMGRILKVMPEMEIENGRKIVDLRNYVIHGYDSVSDSMIWSIVINHLPKLREQVLEQLKK